MDPANLSIFVGLANSLIVGLLVYRSSKQRSDIDKESSVSSASLELVGTYRVRIQELEKSLTEANMNIARLQHELFVIRTAIYSKGNLDNQ